MSSEENQVPLTTAGKKKRLSREIVLSAALSLVDAEASALTMRRLQGQELGDWACTATQKTARRSWTVLELVLNELAMFPDDPDWQAQLRRIAHEMPRTRTPSPQRCAAPRDPPPVYAPGSYGRWISTDPVPVDRRRIRARTPCTSTAPTTATSTGTSSTSCRSSLSTPTKMRPSSAWVFIACRRLRALAPVLADYDGKA